MLVLIIVSTVLNIMTMVTLLSLRGTISFNPSEAARFNPQPSGSSLFADPPSTPPPSGPGGSTPPSGPSGGGGNGGRGNGGGDDDDEDETDDW